MKNDFLTALKEVDNFTFTENGAGALRSTGNAVVDAFGTLGAMKDSDAKDILDTFYKAFYEDRKLAMRLLFYVRDIRGGQGMRRVFRIIARNLAMNKPEVIVDNLDNFLFYGRGDDLMCLIDTPIESQMLDYVKSTLLADMKAVDSGSYPSMLGKWLPSENTSSLESVRLAKKVIKGLGITPRQYRKMLSKLRAKIGIVEGLMSQNKWNEINFEKLPAKAAMIYTDAFMKHVQDMYIDYLKKLASGDVKVNAASLFPVDIVGKINDNYDIKLKDRYLYDAMWKALPNYFGDSEETGICVVDTSGSMHGTPINVALSLGIYCADKCKGPFKNHFITFSAEPKLQEVKGEDIVDKVRNMYNADWMMNTDFEKVFDLILDAAVRNNLSQEDLPSKLYVISDMQFDEARGTRGWGSHNVSPFMDVMKLKFAEKGYTMPAIVYWNVRASKCGMFQETFEGENCCMVSGYSASLFKSVIDGTEVEEEVVVDKVTGEKRVVQKQKIDPVHVMETTLLNERYDRVVA